MLSYIHIQRKVIYLKLTIKSKCEEQKISRYTLAKRIGVTYPTIDRIYKEESTSIKLNILEALCKELHCTPNDILICNEKDDTK